MRDQFNGLWLIHGSPCRPENDDIMITNYGPENDVTERRMIESHKCG
jgi:hypothetical protein